ncbi:MAG: pyrroline-5-carboxylate reductase family protein, partial [Endomicrobiia bacterium]
AYIFYISEIIQDVAVDLGLAKKIVPDLVNYTILGAAKMLVEQQKNFSAEELKNKVTSKGGTTEQALNVFYNKKLKKIFKEAIKKAYFRAKELSKIVSKN